MEVVGLMCFLFPFVSTRQPRTSAIGRAIWNNELYCIRSLRLGIYPCLCSAVGPLMVRDLFQTPAKLLTIHLSRPVPAPGLYGRTPVYLISFVILLSM